MLTTINEVIDFLKQRNLLGIKPGLSRMNIMLAYFGNPEQNLNVIHIAGTNGKGSTLTYIKQALLDNGYNIATFTSPHAEMNEHIQINNQAIDEHSFIQLMNRLQPIIDILDKEDNPPTEYELLFMIALLHFEDKVDFAIIEAGMGGREDFSNCLIPLLSIITNIGKDHVRFLGETYEEIAYHKAGIIKQHVPVVVGELNQASAEVIHLEAKKLDAPIKQYGVDFSSVNVRISRDLEEAFTFVSDEQETDIVISMKGKHQVINASVAYMSLLELNRIIPNQLDLVKTKESIRKATISGRFERILENPSVYVDAAHNQEGITSFINTVNRYFPDKKKHLIFAAFKDKPLQPMVEHFDDTFIKVSFTSFDHPRASSSESLYRLSKHQNKQMNNDWYNVIQQEIMEQQSEDRITFITGSIYFIQLIQNYFENLQKI
ncbi:bifunctional folylpolyglutamate synthase/dihydrofolate synthase [Aquibacillus kalidii]|uniref:bifunctional folylpolyglutamate synthase/dihydrofolate synthase n=1 Tax=Aquibacillus kalidii TaxID=2762597 RepID=UPI0016466293|nr:folylpolyglutamate synthase/dihydrofolate synthase family protein [Aquibacillus kalidii]